MTIAEPRRNRADREDRPRPGAETNRTLLDRMGGPMGFVHSSVPVLVS